MKYIGIQLCCMPFSSSGYKMLHMGWQVLCSVLYLWQIRETFWSTEAAESIYQMPGDCSYHFIGEQQELSNCALSIYSNSSPNYTSSSAAIYTGGNGTIENTTHMGIRGCSKSPYLSAYQNTLRLNTQKDSVYIISGKKCTYLFMHWKWSLSFSFAMWRKLTAKQLCTCLWAGIDLNTFLTRSKF